MTGRGGPCGPMSTDSNSEGALGGSRMLDAVVASESESEYPASKSNKLADAVSWRWIAFLEAGADLPLWTTILDTCGRNAEGAGSESESEEELGLLPLKTGGRYSLEVKNSATFSADSTLPGFRILNEDATCAVIGRKPPQFNYVQQFRIETKLISIGTCYT